MVSSKQSIPSSNKMKGGINVAKYQHVLDQYYKEKEKASSDVPSPNLSSRSISSSNLQSSPQATPQITRTQEVFTPLTQASKSTQTTPSQVSSTLTPQIPIIHQYTTSPTMCQLVRPYLTTYNYVDAVLVTVLSHNPPISIVQPLTRINAPTPMNNTKDSNSTKDSNLKVKKEISKDVQKEKRRIREAKRREAKLREKTKLGEAKVERRGRKPKQQENKENISMNK